MAKLPNPVIVLPGITGTYLSDQYPLPPEFCFTLMRKMFDRVALHPDNPRYEAAEPQRIVPDQVFELVYKELIHELRYNLSASPEEPVPVFPFGYDWRQPLSATAAKFAEFVEEVAERTALLRHYDKAGYAANPKVNVVGHSMGGLIIAGYMRSTGGASKIDRVATLGTPFNGSYEAVVKILTGTAALGGGDSGSREREAARVMPALYHLFPRFKQILPTDEPGLNPGLFPADFFDPKVHQPGVIETIGSYIERYGLGKFKKSELPGRAEALFGALLREAATFRDGVDAIGQTFGDLADRWLCVVGVGSETRVRLRLHKTGGEPDYDLTSRDRRDEWGKASPPARWELTGDGTVPFLGGVPKFLSPENVVCVTPDDYGYWEEIGDRALVGKAGFHAMLPNLDLGHRLIHCHFTSGRADEGRHWGRPAPGVSPGQWDPPITGLKAK